MPRGDAVAQDLDLGLTRLLDDFQKLEKSYVIVGYPAGTITHAQAKQTRHKKAGLSMPQIAAQNEFGVPSRNQPPRPFLYSTVDEQRENINRVIEKQYDKIIEGKVTLKQGLSIIGLYVMKLVDQKIGTLREPKLSPRTIAIKKSDKPLIDFGQMRQALQFKVVIK